MRVRRGFGRQQRVRIRAKDRAGKNAGSGYDWRRAEQARRRIAHVVKANRGNRAPVGKCDGLVGGKVSRSGRPAARRNGALPVRRVVPDVGVKIGRVGVGAFRAA